MSTVKDYKKFIQAENKKRCPTISGKKKADLKRLAESMGYKEPEKKAPAKKAPAKKAPAKKAPAKKAVVKKEAIKKPVVKKAPEKKKPETTPEESKEVFISKAYTIINNFEKEYKKVVGELLKPIRGKKKPDFVEKANKIIDIYNKDFTYDNNPLIKKVIDDLKKIGSDKFPDLNLRNPIIDIHNKQNDRIKRAVRR